MTLRVLVERTRPPFLSAEIPNTTPPTSLLLSNWLPVCVISCALNASLTKEAPLAAFERFQCFLLVCVAEPWGPPPGGQAVVTRVSVHGAD